MNNVRFFIVFMLFFASSVNYADRASLSISKTSLSADLHLDAVRMGYLLSAWGWSYVIAQIPCGWLLDRFGSKRVYGASFFLWSFLVFLMGFAGFLSGRAAFAMLFVLLFLAGFALAPAFPGNGRFVSAWFPAKERGTASAIFNSSQYFSLVLFAPFMSWIVQNLGWKYVFWSMGALGMALTPIWFKFMHNPKDHPRVREAELQYIEAGGGLVNMDMRAATGARLEIKWTHVRQLLGSRMLLGVYLGQFCITTLTYFFIQWYPAYLEHRGLSILTAGFITALSALFGCVGGVLGGVFSDGLLRRGHSLSFARKLPIVAGMSLSCIMMLCNAVNVRWLIIALMCLSFFGKGFGSLGWTVVADTSPKEITGLSGGLFNTFGNMAAITTGIIIGYLIEWTHHFGVALVYVGACALGAVFCYLFVVGEIRRLELRKLNPVAPVLISPATQPKNHFL